MNQKCPLLLLFRHGQTDYNAGRRFQGQALVPLNHTGQVQAARTGNILINVLQSFSAPNQILNCLSSDLPRAMETAQIVSRLVNESTNFNLDFTGDQNFREFDVGDFEGFTVAEFEQKNKIIANAYFNNYEQDVNNTRYPGAKGESRAMVAARLAHNVTALNNSCSSFINTDTANFDLLTQPWLLNFWSTHGGVIDVLLEIMLVEQQSERRIIGNGDLLLLAPEKLVAKPSSVLAAQNNCNIRWRILRHYQVGDNIAARITYSKNESVAK